MNLKKALLVTSCLTALASAALAADATYSKTGTRGDFLVSRGYTSTTTQKMEDYPVDDNGSTLTVGYVCGTNVSLSLITKTSDGSVIGSTAVACGTTPATTTYTAPLYFEKLGVSQTTTVSGTSGVTPTIIESQ